METVGSLAAVVVSVVFAVAGAAKLRGPKPTEAGFVSMGLPSGLVKPVAVFELVLSGALVVRPRVGGTVAAVTLVAFTAVLTRALTRSRRLGIPDVRCNCFGGATPLTTATVGRNTFLVALAVLGSSASRVRLSLPALLVAGIGFAGFVVVRQLLELRSETGSLFPVIGISR